LHCPHDTLYPQKLALTSPTSGGHSVGIVRSRTKGTESFFCFFQEDLVQTQTSEHCSVLRKFPCWRLYQTVGWYIHPPSLSHYQNIYLPSLSLSLTLTERTKRQCLGIFGVKAFISSPPPHLTVQMVGGGSLANLHFPFSLYATLHKKLNGELYRQNDRRLSAKLVLTFADRRCHVVSVTDLYGILGFLGRSRYFSIK
jgi:hypothetical protein